MEMPDGKRIYATHGETVMTSSNRAEMNSLSPCSHEEADTRLMVHALDASLKGHRRVKIRTADEMWITFGLGKHVYNLAAHSIATSLGQDKASVLPMFHARTGCDTVSFFGGHMDGVS